MSQKPLLSIAVVLVLSLAVPSSQAGPFPDNEPLNRFVETVNEDALDSLGHTYAITQAVWTAASASANSVQDLQVPETALTTMFQALGENGAAIVNNTGRSTVGAIGTTGDMARISLQYAGYASLLAQERAGFVLTGDQPPVSALDPTCFPVEVLDTLLDAVQPGAEVPVCAGSFAGDLVIDTEFVTLRSVQGPWATVIDGTVSIEATGVTLTGFTVQGGGVSIGGAGDGYLGEIWGTLLYGNILRGNGAGVSIQHAYGTTLVANTIRANGVGVSVQGVPLLADADPAVGVFLAANNIDRNGAYAIHVAAEVPVPVVSVGDHFGADVVPSVAITDGVCIGGGLTDTRCRNAVSLGVVVAAPNPAPYPML